MADFLTALFLRLCATVNGLGRGYGPLAAYFFFFFIESGMNLLPGGYEVRFLGLSMLNLNLAIINYEVYNWDILIGCIIWWGLKYSHYSQ